MRQLRHYVTGQNETQLPLHPPPNVINLRDEIDISGPTRRHLSDAH